MSAWPAEAVLAGARLGIVATVPTTLEPTARLLARKAAEAGREVALDRCLVEGAFDALLSGDPARHDELLAAEIRCAARSNDAVVLAQASMARLEPSLAPTLGVPLFSSPERGVLDLKETLMRLVA